MRKRNLIRALPLSYLAIATFIVAREGFEPPTTASWLRSNSYCCHCFILNVLKLGNTTQNIFLAL